MQPTAERDGNILIDRLAEQVVAEYETVGLLDDHLGGERPLQWRHQLADRLAGHGGQFGDGELTAENRCDLQQVLDGFRQ